MKKVIIAVSEINGMTQYQPRILGRYLKIISTLFMEGVLTEHLMQEKREEARRSIR